MKKIVILGAGISGLTCAHLLKDTYDITILEKDSVCGGLCQSFESNGFWFDYGAHASFTKNSDVYKLLEENTDTVSSVSEAMNYKSGKWIKQPVQNNLFCLDIEEKINIIKDFISRNNDGVYSDYGDWLIKNYGTYFAQNYPYLYTRKYWTVEPSMLETKWIGPRMYTPDIDEILYGSYSDETSNVHYSGGIRYPKKGGFGKFIENISKDLNIVYDACISEINIEEKTVLYNNEKIEFDEVISTIPLPEIIKLLNNVPSIVKKTAEGLDYTSLILVSLGISKKDVMPNHVKCFYIYDQDILASRVFSTSEYGEENAPDNCTSVQAEVYYSKYKPCNLSLEKVKKRVTDDFIRMGLFSESDILVSDVREKKYANVMFTKSIYNNRKIVHDYLDYKNIYYAGRFGEWDYLWSDQSVLSSMKVVESIKNN